MWGYDKERVRDEKGRKRHAGVEEESNVPDKDGESGSSGKNGFINQGGSLLDVTGKTKEDRDVIMWGDVKETAGSEKYKKRQAGVEEERIVSDKDGESGYGGMEKRSLETKVLVH